MANQVDLTIPSCALYNGHGADRPIDRIRRGDVISIRTPRAPPEVCGKRGAAKGRRDGRLEDKVVDHVVVCRIGPGRGEAEDLHSAIVARGGEELVGRIEGDALDVALVYGQGLELLKGVARPDNDLGVEPDGGEDRVVVGPGQILDVIIVADETLIGFPILDRWGLIRSCARC